MNKQPTKYQRLMFENIYDLIKGGKFEPEARKELKAFIRDKNIEWDGDNNIISLGKHFKINLEVQ